MIKTLRIFTLVTVAFLAAPVFAQDVVRDGALQGKRVLFIVGQAGVALGVLTQDQYSLILAGALLSIMVNPLFFLALDYLRPIIERMWPEAATEPSPKAEEAPTVAATNLPTASGCSPR